MTHTPTVSAIGICGPAAVGTSTLSARLKRALPQWHFRSGGDSARELYARSGSTLSLSEFMERTDGIDLQIECANSEFVQTQHLNGGCVLEARLARVALRNIPTARTVLLQCDDKVRAQREVFRSRQKGIEKTPDDALVEILDRDRRDSVRYQNQYGQTNIFDPRDYDLVIDTGFFDADARCRQVLEFCRLAVRT